jgi:hypothetical protein
MTKERDVLREIANTHRHDDGVIHSHDLADHTAEEAAQLAARDDRIRAEMARIEAQAQVERQKAEEETLQRAFENLLRGAVSGDATSADKLTSLLAPAPPRDTSPTSVVVEQTLAELGGRHRKAEEERPRSPLRRTFGL